MPSQYNAWIFFIFLYSVARTILCSEAFTPWNVRGTLSLRMKASRLPVFRELITDDQEDLRADISVIIKQDGLNRFLQADHRLCVIKLYAPYCKACKAFGVKFRKLALEKGDRINAAGDVVHPGIARFGEIEYSSNIKLCKHLDVKKFPTVLIYRGGKESELIGEIDCKNISIENLVSEMDNVAETVEN
eukprot:CCRYP_005512-RA/>CCRYP_005512-RA protein AED:0.02 eAED:0.02 QI:192/1/1/1/0.5/0.33/3/1284/188